jgi:hypothetical protein
MLLASGCAHERKMAAIATQCPAEQMKEPIKELTPEEGHQAAMVVANNVVIGIGMTVVIAVGIVLGAAMIGTGHVPHGGFRVSDGEQVFQSLPESTEQYPHVWQGCGQVALCDAHEQCDRAEWMTPEGLPALMEQSAKGPFTEQGIGDCGDPPPLARRTGPLTWSVIVCHEELYCYPVTAPQHFACLRKREVPKDGISRR